jgi:hypothetical protein
VSVYSKTNKKLYLKDDTGAEYELLTSGSPVGPSYLVDYFELDSAQEAAKEVTLSDTPTEPTRTIVDVMNGGGALRYGLDFTVSGDTLSWASGRFDGILASGDELRVIFY